MDIKIETRRLPSGNLEVLLEKPTGDYKGSKLHRELFEMPDNETTSLFEQHLRRMNHNG